MSAIASRWVLAGSSGLRDFPHIGSCLRGRFELFVRGDG